MNLQELQKEITDKEIQISLLQSRLWVIRKEIQDSCDHPDSYEYEWEHDNGYGRQTKIKGLRCRFCLKVDYWKTGQFIEC